MNSNYLTELFISEAAKALDRHNGTGGGTSENLDAVLTEQGTLIQELKEELEGKVAGGDENFVGVRLSNFAENVYKLPRVADARSLQNILDNIDESNRKYIATIIGAYLFTNNNTGANGGLYASLEEAYIPNGITGLQHTFRNCTKLKVIHGDFTSVNTTLSAFEGCTSLLELPYMPNLNYIGGTTFKGCTGLTKAYLYKKPSTFTNTAFTNCTNLLDIYVPWAEGEVANAPWGATNATIHYNTVYDENHEPIV